jgi:hypothetical protein
MLPIANEFPSPILTSLSLSLSLSVSFSFSLCLPAGVRARYISRLHPLWPEREERARAKRACLIVQVSI